MADEQKNSLEDELSDLFNEFEGSTEATEEQAAASEEPAPEETPQQVEEEPAPAPAPAPAAAKPLMGKKSLMPAKGGLRNPAAQTTARPPRPLSPQEATRRPGLTPKDMQVSPSATASRRALLAPRGAAAANPAAQAQPAARPAAQPAARPAAQPA
ncbi:MAG: hypothetical protein IJJ33_06580, partial [Victivallales bacterium]|nr:hypothetical protein [Victivallales bacterium]